ncbi:hypothetical protein U1Q18_013234 [Sarracenia purpurea var. burkii]
MCYGPQRLLSKDEITSSRPRTATTDAALVEDLRNRLAETESRLELARAREAALTRRLEEMKRFVSVMEILETYLKRCFVNNMQKSAVCDLRHGRWRRWKPRRRDGSDEIDDGYGATATGATATGATATGARWWCRSKYQPKWGVNGLIDNF